MNLYVYVGNNPVNFVDPSGMVAKEVGIVVISMHPSYDVGGAIGGVALYVKGVYEGNEEYKKYGLEGAFDSGKNLLNFTKKIKKGGEVVKIIKKETDEIIKNKQVKETLERITKGEPKYSKDGSTFSNDGRKGGEKLPSKEEGYYKEWTIETPGAKNRGTQRIVTGGSGEMYYTPDHYESFIRIK